MLVDPNFYQTLVLITEHGNDGALGLVMNRPLGKRLGELSEAEFPERLRSVPVFQGGPVKPSSLLLAHFQCEKDEEDLHCDILESPPETIEPSGPGSLRAFVGYAGWGEGQLERELRERSWWFASRTKPCWTTRFPPRSGRRS